MKLTRIRRLITKTAARHASPLEQGGSFSKPSGRHAAPRSRRRPMFPPAAAAAVVIACAAAVTLHDAVATAGTTTPATPIATASVTTAPLGSGMVDPSVEPYLAPKLLKEVPVGPGNVAKPVDTVLQSAQVTTALDRSGIPTVALQAYKHAAGVLAVTDPGCHLPWELLAGIGRVESNHGRFGGAQLLSNGYGTKPIRGIPLDGRPGVVLIRDTDGGKLDGDPNFDRAVGPLQFIPSTWAAYGADGNGDGTSDPNNIFDAALGAAHYLCKGGGDLTNPAQEAAAVRHYNNAEEYVRVVLATAASYAAGKAATIPSAPAVVAPGPIGPRLTASAPTAPRLTASAPTAPVPPAPAPAAPAVKPAAPQPATSASPTRSAAPIAAAPAPTTSPKTTTKPAPPATSAPAPTTSASVSPAPMPTGTAMAAPTETAMPGPTAAAPVTAAPAPATPLPPDQPAPATSAPTAQPAPAAQTAATGWAPAMRQVVVQLLTSPASN